MKQHTVVFLPSKVKGLVPDGTSIRDAANLISVGIETICGGNGTCGKCRVRILEGEHNGIISRLTHLSPPSQLELNYAEKHGLRNDERLSCQVSIIGDVAVFVPEESRVRSTSYEKTIGGKIVDIIPSIKKYWLQLSSEADWIQLTAELASQFDLNNLVIASHLKSDDSRLLQNGGDVTCTVWNDEQVIRIEQGKSEGAYGLALDIGTTTVAGYLCDLNTGKVLDTESVLNPQIRFGEDIMNRIAYAQSNPDGLDEMNREIISAVNKLIHLMVSRLQLEADDIAEVVMVGNTVMHHIFLGMDIIPLGKWPFSPATEESLNRMASMLGLETLPDANVHCLPIEAAFVGADNVGVMIAEEPYNQDEMLLIIDVGTNGELLLGNRERMLSASCATGPAFEGGNIKFGMRAADGAIERVRIDPKTLEVSYKTIGRDEWSAETDIHQIQSRGICGSGIIEAAAQMLTTGIVGKDGRFNKDADTQRLRTDSNGRWEFVVAWSGETSIGKDIVVTQMDVRAIQLGKAALFTGCQMLLNKLGIDKPDKVILAGAFGAVIDPVSALAIGMFPDCGLDNIFAVGNAAGDGAVMALFNKDKRLEAQQVARQVEYIELTTEPGFNDCFFAATHFPQASV